MANLFMTLLLPVILFIGLLFSWQTKKRKTEKHKPPESRVTVFYNPVPENTRETVSKKQPQLIRVPKSFE
jgi:hypothetical protein